MMNFVSYSEDIFKVEKLEDGEMRILFSGSLVPNSLNPGSWDEEEWEWNPNFTEAGVADGSFLKVIGVSISTTPLGSKKNILNSLKVCEKLTFTFRLGDSERTVFANVKKEDKSYYDGYVYFKLDTNNDIHIPGPISNIEILFSKKSEIIETDGQEEVVETFLDAKCTSDPTVLSVDPFDNPVVNSNFNPIINNVTDNVKSSWAKKVESVPTLAFPYDSDAEMVSQYQPTDSASIVDSFFTEMSNIAGRYLGSKNSQETVYLGNKEKYTQENLKIFEDSIQEWLQNNNQPYPRPDSGSIIELGKDRSFFEVVSFTGSVYLSGSVEDAISSIGISNMQLETLAFTQGPHLAVLSTSILTPTDVDPLTNTDSASVYIPRIGTFPELGDIVYNSPLAENRLVESKIYIPDLNKILVTDTKGHVVASASVSS